MTGFMEISQEEMYAIDGGVNAIKIVTGSLQVVAGVFIAVGGVTASSNPFTAAIAPYMIGGGSTVAIVGIKNIISGIKK